MRIAGRLRACESASKCVCACDAGARGCCRSSSTPCVRNPIQGAASLARSCEAKPVHSVLCCSDLFARLLTGARGEQRSERVHDGGGCCCSVAIREQQFPHTLRRTRTRVKTSSPFLPPFALSALVLSLSPGEPGSRCPALSAPASISATASFLTLASCCLPLLGRRTRADDHSLTGPLLPFSPSLALSPSASDNLR